MHFYFIYLKFFFDFENRNSFENFTFSKNKKVFSTFFYDVSSYFYLFNNYKF